MKLIRRNVFPYFKRMNFKWLLGIHFFSFCLTSFYFASLRRNHKYMWRGLLDDLYWCNSIMNMHSLNFPTTETVDKWWLNHGVCVCVQNLSSSSFCHLTRNTPSPTSKTTKNGAQHTLAFIGRVNSEVTRCLFVRFALIWRFVLCLNRTAVAMAVKHEPNHLNVSPFMVSVVSWRSNVVRNFYRYRRLNTKYFHFFHLRLEFAYSHSKSKFPFFFVLRCGSRWMLLSF